MKLKHLLMTTSICAVVAVPAFAQSLAFSDVDSNGDAQLSLEELEAAFGSSGADAIMDRSDLDGNGTVSAPEIRVSQDDASDDSDDDERNGDDNGNDSSADDGEDDHGGDDGESDSGGDDGESDSGGDDGESDSGGDDGESDDGESDD